MADFTFSPGIVTNEIDKSVRTEVLSTGSVAGLIGSFNWGAAMIPNIIRSEKELVTKYGEPTVDNYIEWFNGKNFLEYGDSLNVVRVIDEATATNATFSGSPVLIKNDVDYVETLIIEEGGLKDSSASGIKFGATSSYGGWIAKFPGISGNALRVEMCFADAQEDKIELLDAANTSVYINQVEFTPIVGSANKYTVKFYNNNAGTNTAINVMGTSTSYFEDRSDVLATSNPNHQERVVTFVRNSNTYNMLIESITATGEFEAYVNIGADGVVGTSLTTETFVGDDLTELTIRKRSFYQEHSYDDIVSSPQNLMGKVYHSHNSNIVEGIGTAFTKQIGVGDLVTVSGQSAEVISVISDTQLQLNKNIVGVVASTSPTSYSRKWKYSEYFTGAPATSNYARTINSDVNGIYNDQLHMVVIDKTGSITGSIGEVLESYGFMSLAKDGKSDFRLPIYYVNVVNGASDWVKWANHPINASTTSNWGSSIKGTVFDTYHKNLGTFGTTYGCATFAGGLNGDPIDDADVADAIDLFASAETVDLDFFLTGWTNPASSINYAVTISKMLQMVEDRKDAVVAISGEYHMIAQGKSKSSAIVDAFVDWRSNIINSSYGFMDGNFKYQYDAYNDTYRWLPLSGDIAGLMARVDKDQFSWYSPAGINRGQIKNVVKLAFNPSQTERDSLYLSQINPVVSFKNEGVLLYGDKTLQKVASAFDRINVRRLFITVRAMIVEMARRNIFEFNTPQTRSQFRYDMNKYLETVVTNQGISAFEIVCDESNNTPELIEAYKFVADIKIRPNYVINFVKLNFIAVGQSVSFDEV